MSDFKNFREMMEYCLSGGVVIHEDDNKPEGVNKRGEWGYIGGLQTAVVFPVGGYSKHIPPKKTKKVKLLAYLASCGELKMYTEDKVPTNFEWQRVPSEDKEIEIEIEE